MAPVKCERNIGERSFIVLNDLDLKILNVLNKQKKDILIMDVTQILKLSHPSLKKHVRKLTRFGFVSKHPVPKTRGIILRITSNGKLQLKLFKNIPLN